MKIFYHRGDLDGKASGAILKKRYPDAELIGAEYGDDVPAYIASIKDGEDVFIVDYMFEPFTSMVELSKRCNLFWIDHHWFAIRQYIAAGKPIPAYVGDEKNEKAACELAWEHCFPDQPVPETVKLLSLYDVWRHNNDNRILSFQFGARYYLHSMTTPQWEHVLNSDPEDQEETIEEYCYIGNILRRYQEQNSKSMAREYAFEATFEGYKAIVMNSSSKGSGLFKSVLKPHHQLMMVFCMTSDRKFKFSVYSEDKTIDCGALCNKYGGGGHVSAAGFVATNLDFLV